MHTIVKRNVYSQYLQSFQTALTLRFFLQDATQRRAAQISPKDTLEPLEYECQGPYDGIFGCSSLLSNYSCCMLLLHYRTRSVCGWISMRTCRGMRPWRQIFFFFLYRVISLCTCLCRYFRTECLCTATSCNRFLWVAECSSCCSWVGKFALILHMKAQVPVCKRPYNELE